MIDDVAAAAAAAAAAVTAGGVAAAGAVAVVVVVVPVGYADDATDPGGEPLLVHVQFPPAGPERICGSSQFPPI
jgi:hypothetical protein